jgi:hypothetical protein
MDRKGEGMPQKVVTPKPSVTEVHEALRKIVENSGVRALNYAVNYAKYGLSVFNPDELKTQCLYVLNNMANWRGDEAKAVRITLKAFAGVK